jgi:predicted Zn-ribbon and HTH transcriptional regulator
MVIMNCPICQSGTVRRSKRRTIAERTIMTALLVRPFRCVDCGRRFFRLSLHKNVRPKPAENSTELTNGKTPDLLGGEASRLNLHLG